MIPSFDPLEVLENLQNGQHQLAAAFNHQSFTIAQILEHNQKLMIMHQNTMAKQQQLELRIMALESRCIKATDTL